MEFQSSTNVEPAHNAATTLKPTEVEEGIVSLQSSLPPLTYSSQSDIKIHPISFWLKLFAQCLYDESI